MLRLVSWWFIVYAVVLPIYWFDCFVTLLIVNGILIVLFIVVRYLDDLLCYVCLYFDFTCVTLSFALVGFVVGLLIVVWSLMFAGCFVVLLVWVLLL